MKALAKTLLAWALVLSWAALLWEAPRWASYVVATVILIVGLAVAARGRMNP